MIAVENEMADLPATCETCGRPTAEHCRDGIVRLPGERSGEMCEALKDLQRKRAVLARTDEISLLWPIPARYAVCKLELPSGMRGTPIESAYATAHRFLAHLASGNDPCGANLLIYGENGVGKTHLAAAIALEANRHGLTAIYCEETRFLNRLKSCFDSRHCDEGEPTESDILEAAETCDLLVLDDVGKAQRTEWARAALWSVFNGRYENERASIITTNLSAKALAGNEQWLAIVSRLQETGRSIEIKGRNLRLEESVPCP